MTSRDNSRDEQANGEGQNASHGESEVAHGNPALRPKNQRVIQGTSVATRCRGEALHETTRVPHTGV